MDRTRTLLRNTLGLTLLVAMLLPSSGCAGLLATMMYRGRIAPAEYSDLEGRRVAVICTAHSGDFGPNPNAGLLAERVGMLLEQNVPEIELIPHREVEAWHDEHDVDFIDYDEVGRGLKADVVVAIELEHLQLQDNATLYKGQAEYALRVIDIADGGKEVYAPITAPVVYPRIAGLHTTSVSERQFRQKFLNVMAGEIGKHFYEHDLNEDIAIDTPDLSGQR